MQHNTHTHTVIKSHGSTYTHTQDIIALSGQVCDAPSGSLSSFEGSIKLVAGGASSGTHPIGKKQLLLRGSILRSTNHVWGIAVYTGHETKVR